MEAKRRSGQRLLAASRLGYGQVGCMLAGTQFTCFTGAKVQILTLQASRSSFESARATLLLENAVAGMHQATKRMAGGAKEVSVFALLYQ